MAFVKVSECLTNPRQLIKLILLVVCICITIYQLSECVNKLLHPPITSYYKFKYNTTIKYPSLTICRRPNYKTHLFPMYGVKSTTKDLTAKDVFKTFKFESYTISEFINATTYDFIDIAPIYGFKGVSDGKNLEFRSSLFPGRGRCHTLIPKETVDTFSIGTGFWLYLPNTTNSKTTDANGLSTSGYEIHFHNENDVIREEQNSVKTDFVYVERSENVRVILTVQTYSLVSTSETPCSSDPSYGKSKCEEKCFHNSIAKELGCSLPWLRNLDTEYEECSNATVLANLGNLTSPQARENSLEKCFCPIPCNNSIYTYQIENRRDADTLQSPSSTVTIYFNSNLVTHLSEVISYDWNIFLADVGGSLGFLLGLSVIGFVNLIEGLIKMFFKIKKSKEKEILGDDQKSPRVSTVSTNMTDVDGESLKSVMEWKSDMYPYFQDDKDEKDEKEKTSDEKGCISEEKY